VELTSANGVWGLGGAYRGSRPVELQREVTGVEVRRWRSTRCLLTGPLACAPGFWPPRSGSWQPCEAQISVRGHGAAPEAGNSGKQWPYRAVGPREIPGDGKVWGRGSKLGEPPGLEAELLRGSGGVGVWWSGVSTGAQRALRGGATRRRRLGFVAALAWGIRAQGICGGQIKAGRRGSQGADEEGNPRLLRR